MSGMNAAIENNLASEVDENPSAVEDDRPDSAEKEPSMEEILASIRRIIAEDGPTASEASAISSQSNEDVEDGLPAGAPEFFHAPPQNQPVKEPDVVLPATASPETQTAAESSPMPASTSNGGAHLEAVSDPTPTSHQPIPAFPDNHFQTAKPSQLDEAKPDSGCLAGEDESPVAAVSPRDSSSGDGAGRPAATASDTVMNPSNRSLEPADTAGFETGDDQDEIAPPPLESDEVQNEEPASDPLLSDEANTAISLAFDNLADSLLSDRDAEMENVAERLMRPMLKEWLEDNLPTLVERVVREEIERVSRGR